MKQLVRTAERRAQGKAAEGLGPARGTDTWLPAEAWYRCAGQRAALAETEVKARKNCGYNMAGRGSLGAEAAGRPAGRASRWQPRGGDMQGERAAGAEGSVQGRCGGGWVQRRGANRGTAGVESISRVRGCGRQARQGKSHRLRLLVTKVWLRGAQAAAAAGEVSWLRRRQRAQSRAAAPSGRKCSGLQTRGRPWAWG